GTIAAQTGGFPYYVHWVVSELRMGGRPVTADDIDLIVRRLLTAPHDPCNLRQFKERLATYYPGEENVLRELLDHPAVLSPLTQAELINVAKSAGATDDNRVRDLLRLLAQDHYLTREADGKYSFRHVLLRRWWVIEEGLE